MVGGEALTIIGPHKKNIKMFVSEKEGAKKINRSIVYLCPWTAINWKISIKIRTFCVQLCLSFGQGSNRRIQK